MRNHSIGALAYRIGKIIRILLNRRYLKALFLGSAACVEDADILRQLNCRYVVDAGANRGQFALAARHELPHAKIISFEPLAEPAHVFRKIFRDDPLTELHELALGSHTMMAEMHVMQMDYSSSLLAINKTQPKVYAGLKINETREIAVKALDEIIQKEEIPSPALLKIDVQGYELEVLKGCESLLGSFDHVLVECSFVEIYAGQALAHEVIDFLAEHDFCLRGVYQMWYDGSGMAIQGDLLFSRS